MKLTITCVSFKRYLKNSLVGFADVAIAELRLTIKNVTLHQRGGSRWVSPPGCAWAKDGQLVTDDHGKIQYSQVFEFADRATRNAFGEAVWSAAIKNWDQIASELGQNAALLVARVL